MNILVTLDRNYLPPLRVMLGSLLRNDPGETFEIYAIGDGLLPEDWAALEELCAGRGRIHPLEVPADLFADAPVARYWTRAMYYRLLAAELLPRSLDRVLYLDPDILVINPVRALYDTDLEGDLMAAATHTGLLAGITDPVNRLRLENYEAEAYYNSGVLVMDLSAMRRVTSSTMPGSTPTFCCCRTRTCSTACTADRSWGWTTACGTTTPGGLTATCC